MYAMCLFNMHTCIKIYVINLWYNYLQNSPPPITFPLPKLIILVLWIYGQLLGEKCSGCKLQIITLGGAAKLLTGIFVWLFCYYCRLHFYSSEALVKFFSILGRDGLIRNVDKEELVNVIYLDFQKAFDKFPKQTLYQKDNYKLMEIFCYEVNVGLKINSSSAWTFLT